MAKKILSVALALIMCLSLFPTIVSAEESTSLKDMIDTFSGTYVFNSETKYGNYLQKGTSTLTLNENEFWFETILVFYKCVGDIMVPECNVATKFRFDETGYNDWSANTFVNGKPRYVAGDLIPDYTIENLLDETEVEFLEEENLYKMSLFEMMDFCFYDMQGGKTQKAVYREVVYDRSENDQTIVITAPAGEQAEEPTKITSETAIWSKWMIAEQNVTINSDVIMTSDTNLILADGVELTVNGTINTANKLLTVYGQNSGTGKLTVNGTTDGVFGNITVNGGNINIFGGESTYRGGVGVFRSNFTVNDGTVTITGGDGITQGYGGWGMSDSHITVNGGYALVKGGSCQSSEKTGKAFDGSNDWIDATIKTSPDGVRFARYNNKDELNTFYCLKFTPAVEPEIVNDVTYIDAQGNKQTVDAQLITEDSIIWSGWVLASGDVTIYEDVRIDNVANLILADGATLTVKGTVDSPVNTPDELLTVYAQDSGTGKLTVKAAAEKRGFIGSLTVTGGVIDIIGGETAGALGGTGLFYSRLIMSGGKVTVTGGAGSGIGAQSCPMTVTGGELNIVGGSGGYGMYDSGIDVTGGVVTVTGGVNENGVRQKAFAGEDEWLNAKIYYSTDGETYNLLIKDADNYKFLKLLPKDAPEQTPSHIDEQTEKQETATSEQQTPDKGNGSQKKADNELISPNTGDTINLVLWIVLIAVSLSVTAAYLTYDKKRKTVK